MPELPEVEVVKRSLERNISNLIIKKVKINDGNLRYKVSKNGFIKLKGLFVGRAEDAKRKKTHPWTFKIYNPNTEHSRVYYLYADSANTESVWIKWIREEINHVNGKSFGSTDDKLIDLDQYNVADASNEFGNVDDNNEFGNVDDNNELGNPFNNINNNDEEKNVANKDGDKDDDTSSAPRKGRSTLSNFSNMY